MREEKKANQENKEREVEQSVDKAECNSPNNQIFYNLISNSLGCIGFAHLQKSVWVGTGNTGV